MRTGTSTSTVTDTTTVGKQGRPDTSTAVANLIRFLETGSVPDGLFAPDVFSDLSLPHWRIQAAGQAARAIQFADEAMERAQRVSAPELLADCLDAALAAHWGPDELDVRRSLANDSTMSPPTSWIPTHGCEHTCGACRLPARRSTSRRYTGRCVLWKFWVRSLPERSFSRRRGG
jgi:hypothetical protein